jgi:hypothetical protein
MAPVMLLVVETLFISGLVASLIYGLRGVGL